MIVLTVFLNLSISEFQGIMSKLGFNKVKSIEFDKNEFYNQNDGTLWNLERSDYVFPNDRLRYYVKIEQKHPHPIEIESHMQIFVGDKNVTNIIPHQHKIRLGPDELQNALDYNFTAYEGGLNTVKVDLLIINASNKIQLDHKSEILKFDVQSQAIETQTKANQILLNTSIGAIIVSLILAIVTTWQVKIQRDEINARMRPWLGRKDVKDNIKVVNHNNKRLLIVALVNNGELPAMKLKTQSFISCDLKYDESELGEPPYDEGYDTKVSLGKNEPYYFRMPLSPQEYHFYEKHILSYAIKITYENSINGVKGFYEIRGHFENQLDIIDLANVG